MKMTLSVKTKVCKIYIENKTLPKKINGKAFRIKFGKWNAMILQGNIPRKQLLFS